MYMGASVHGGLMYMGANVHGGANVHRGVMSILHWDE